MFILQTPRRRRAKEEAEKPLDFFFRPYDCFNGFVLDRHGGCPLVLTQSLRTMEDKRRDRETTILACLADMAKIALNPEFDGVKINGQTIDFGPWLSFVKTATN